MVKLVTTPFYLVERVTRTPGEGMDITVIACTDDRRDAVAFCAECREYLEFLTSDWEGSGPDPLEDVCLSQWDDISYEVREVPNTRELRQNRRLSCGCDYYVGCICYARR